MFTKLVILLFWYLLVTHNLFRFSPQNLLTHLLVIKKNLIQNGSPKTPSKIFNIKIFPKKTKFHLVCGSYLYQKDYKWKEPKGKEKHMGSLITSTHDFHFLSQAVFFVFCSNISQKHFLLGTSTTFYYYCSYLYYKLSFFSP